MAWYSASFDASCGNEYSSHTKVDQLQSYSNKFLTNFFCLTSTTLYMSYFYRYIY
jgi:hypothetical protein